MKLKLETVLFPAILDYLKAGNKYSANSLLQYILVESLASKLQVFSTQHHSN
jgi:hypothetical protein